MTEPGRNMPCPCGSGQKYKKCCQEKHQAKKAETRGQRSAIRTAIDWLREEYATEVQEAISLDFFGERSEEDLDKILGLPRGIVELVHDNMEEWLLCDAELMLNDEPKSALELILGLKGPVLTAQGKNWLTALAAESLGLYQVVSTQAQEVVLKDLLATETAPLRVGGADMWDATKPGEIFGARLVRQNNRLVFSGAYYPFFDEMAADCLNAIQEEFAREQPAAWERRQIIAVVLIEFFLESLIQMVDDEQETNPSPR